MGKARRKNIRMIANWDLKPPTKNRGLREVQETNRNLATCLQEAFNHSCCLNISTDFLSSIREGKRSNMFSAEFLSIAITAPYVQVSILIQFFLLFQFSEKYIFFFEAKFCWL